MPRDPEKGSMQVGSGPGYGSVGEEGTVRPVGGFAAIAEVATSFAPLGFVAFGGPMAHIGLLQTVFVEEKKWMTDETFMELQALGHSLPGPTSTQMVVAVAASRGGLLGAFVAFCLWSLPAFIVLVSAAAGANVLKAEMSEIWWLQGLPPAAVALIFSAAYKMGNKSCNDNITRFLGLMSSCVIVTLSSSDVPLHVFDFMYPGLLIAGGLTTLVWYSIFPKENAPKKTSGLDVHLSAAFGGFLVLVWAGLFAFFSYSRFVLGNDDKFLTLTETFYRIGSVIFGGGQVVLPMLLTQVVGPGWVTEEQFYSGMALTQACPGPLFNFSAYLGAVRAGIPGALAACFGLFFPGCILILAVSPFWLKIRDQPFIKPTLAGINAAAVGFVFAAVVMLYGQTVHKGADAVVVIVVAATAGGFGFSAPAAIATGGAMGAVLALFEIGLNPM